mgnify:FL=1|tara:strand:- start:465 stop:959 length:495 start_codon:yes stop_codon:yes gene_type:complete
MSEHYDVDVDENGPFIVPAKEPYVIKCYGCGDLTEILDMDEEIPTNRPFAIDYKNNKKIAYVHKDYKGKISSDSGKCTACCIAFGGKYGIINLILFVSLVLSGCATTHPQGYTMTDRFDSQHEYDIDREPDKDSTVLYCQSHYKWETIRFYYTNEGLTYWIRSK